MSELAADSDATPTAAVVGLGLIGGSVAAGLRRAGWQVTGTDADAETCSIALDRGLIDAVAVPADVDLVVIATPVSEVPAAARDALDTTGAVITDVGSVKGPIVEAVRDPRFVPGHPMAGSELDGIHGADPDLFAGAVWVITPDEATADRSLALVTRLATTLGADPVVLGADVHDAVVAVVSHVPHLTAAALMGLAADRSTEHAVLLRLAAGGFRDMTRISAGRPGIWPSICADNRTAIVEVLDELVDRLVEVRKLVDAEDRDELLVRLESARSARVSLPARARAAGPLVEVRVPVPDRPGVLAEVTALATDLGVNIHDVEMAHSAESVGGVMILVVSAEPGDAFVEGLVARGYRPGRRELS